MSSSAAMPALPLLPIAPLDGADGYLRWKESVLLRLRTLGTGYVLLEERPAGETASSVRWGRDDELSRGYILAALSDRLLPVYAHHSTARAVWRAVALTYDLDMMLLSNDKFSEFRLVEGGEPFLEQLALLQALAASARIEEPHLFDMVKEKLPSDLSKVVSLTFPSRPCMDDIWEAARVGAVIDMVEENRLAQAELTTDEQGSTSSDDSRCAKRRRQAEPC
jgi:hypothetical protein